MYKQLFLGILFLTTASVPFVSGQRTLSIDEVRNLAIENNKNLKIASEQERVAYYNKKEAFSKYLPDISLMGAYLRNQKNLQLIPSSAIPASITVPDLSSIGITLPYPPGTEIPISDDIRNKIRGIGEIDIKNIWVGGVTLVQPLFMGGKIVAYNDIMKNSQQLAAAQKDTKLQDIITEVDAAYWQVVSLADKKTLAGSYKYLLEKMHSDISIMEQEGVATKADVLSVSVKLNEADVALTKVDNGLALSRMALNQLCGLPIEENISLLDEENNIQTQIPSVPELASVEEALTNRSELKSLELATKIYKGKERVARSEFMPNLAFMASYLYTNPSGFDGFDTKFGGMWTLGLTLKVPLNIMSSSAKYNAAKAETRIQQYQLDEAKEKIELQVNQSNFKLSEAYKKYASSEKNMEKADENLRYANVGFEEGVIPASDVIAAHTAWLSAHSELIDSKIDIKLCKVYLNKALGRNLTEK
ncbi:TolC family protein [Dysgonomonas macrotermitis]|uniref:Outer membrane protein TolC n=1 Tax=Dysgonomonas macrotermitis TaxID=1346286 RepID=A0A1M5IG00_9BACT|nr:TolC family protein [Dysgonomonas macrotermitis]SHG26713.1 Outer membrane protein TolC [Dysgonomonas macrotermitis]